MADIEELAEQLVGLTIKEANELANHLEEEYDIKPASAGVAVAAGDGGGGDRAVHRREAPLHRARLQRGRVVLFPAAVPASSHRAGAGV